jgi:head-tail adaptor
VVSLASLLTQTVTVQTRSTGVADDYGNLAQTWSVGTDYDARLEQQDGTEAAGDQLVVTSNYLLILPADAVISAGDRVTDEDGNTYEVIGPPVKQRTPRGVHHIEARLTSTEAL